MRKNMKIPWKKEKPEQPIIILRITRLLAGFELTKKQSNRRNGSYDKEQCEKCLWMEALQDSEFIPEGGRRLWQQLVPDIPLVVSMDWNLHVKDCSSQ